MFVKKVLNGLATTVLVVGGLGSVGLSAVLAAAPPPVPPNHMFAAGAIGIVGLMALIWSIIEIRKH